MEVTGPEKEIKGLKHPVPHRKEIKNIFISPPFCNFVLSCTSVVLGICYLAAIPIIAEKNYFLVAVLLFFLHIIVGVLGGLYCKNRRLEIYEEHIVYKPPFGKAVCFSPFSAEVVVIKGITPRHGGGMIIQVGRKKIRVPNNYDNYGVLEQTLLRTAKAVREKYGIM